MDETLNTQNIKKGNKRRFSLTLRAKILLGILMVVLVTVSAMGYFVFYRSQQTNQFLIVREPFRSPVEYAEDEP